MAGASDGTNLAQSADAAAQRFAGRSVALFGRFTTRPRRAFAEAVSAAGGRIARDLTRGSDLLVVGLGALKQAESAAFAARLWAARARGRPIFGEERLRDRLAGRGERVDASVAEALTGAPLDDAALALLAAFDVIRLDGARCRVEDLEALGAAAELAASGLSAPEIVRSLRAARTAPPGRRRLAPLGDGRVALEWADDNALTTLDGQRFLPMDLGETLEDAFERAAEAEAQGRAGEAMRLYELCARADRADPIAPYNLANLQMRAGRGTEAMVYYRLAIAREPRFAEAQCDLAAALEAAGDLAAAERALEAALAIDPGYADALFSLAQLKLRREAFGAARALFERYLAEDVPPRWRGKAERARRLLQTRMDAS